MEVDYSKLYELRKKTRLNLIERLKIMKMKNQAIDDWQLINKIEHCHLGVDFRKADEFEYSRRLEKYNRKIRG